MLVIDLVFIDLFQGPIENGRQVEMKFLEDEKKFDPEEVYKGQPNPTKI